MADKTIPDLTAAASVALTDLIEISDAGPSSKKATITQVQSAITSGFVPTSRTIATTGPLAGGGDLSANRTFSIADAVADGATKGAAAFTSADFNSAAGVVSIDYTNGQAASAGAKGFLTAADWTTFNNKQASLGFTPPPNTRLISTTAPLAGGGDLTADRTLSIADAVADGATKGAAAFAATDFNAAAGVISIDYTNGQAASAVNKGFLTAADWTTFNSKQASLGFTPINKAGDTGMTGSFDFGGGAIILNANTGAASFASSAINMLLTGGANFATGSFNIAPSGTLTIGSLFTLAASNANTTWAFAGGSVVLTNSGLAMGTHPITGMADPTNAQDAATKAYVDSVAGGAPFIDSTAIIKGSADATKLLRIEVDGFTTGTTRVATPPNQDFTIAGTNVEQTFSVQQTFSATDDESVRVTGSITGSNNQPFVEIAGIWNTTETVRAVLINITDTASDANSSLLRCELGGSFRMNVDKVGGIQLAGGVSALGGITSTFSLAGSSATSFIDLTGTWNTSGTPTGIRMNVTDTASNAVSKLIDLQIGAATKFAVDKTGSITFADGIRQIFNPNGTNAGINVGAHTDDPSSLTNGDLWYQSTANELRARINGATVALGAGGGASPPFDDGTAIIKGSADATKLLRIEVDGFTTATTRVATPPNQDFTIAGTNVAQTFTVEQTFTPAANTEAITITGFSLTGANAQSFIDISGTWNTSGNPSGIKLNVTNTASGGLSKLIDCQVGGSNKFSVSKDGGVSIGTVFAMDGITGSSLWLFNGGANIVNISPAGTGFGLLPVSGITTFTAASGNFIISGDGSFTAAGGPFAVDSSSNLTINQALTFNNTGYTINDDGTKLVFSSDIEINAALTFTAGNINVTSDGTRFVFSSNIQIGTATLDDNSGALETNTFIALTALQVAGCQLIITGGDTFVIQSGFDLQFGTAAASGILVATHSIRVKDSAGTSYDLLCRSV